MSAAMKALVCRTLSDDLSALKLEAVEVPKAGPGQVLMKMRAASVNFPDLLMVAGKYQFKPPMPFSPGMEGAGVIADLGEGVSGFRIGDEVVAGLRYGGFAEYAIADTRALRHKPPNMSFAEAASFPAAYLTAWVALHHRGMLQAGETLLVHGASGGVGMAAIDLGLMMNATVIATSASAEKRAIIKARGAHHVLDATGFKDEVKRLTGGSGADVIYDPVGGDVFEESLRCIAWGGRVLIIGFASGRIPSIPANLPLIKGFSVIGVRAGEFGRRDPEKGAANLVHIDALAASGKIRPHVCAEFPLERARDAMQLLKDRKVIGKVVVTMA
ncbi:MAG TPA: NADPH:quinone oxidoreductase family protein [Micropepsaceae bacterium]|nr:NADPH:quinone oxidoreductase family protein [Micropepsaceae bacterium]